MKVRVMSSQPEVSVAGLGVVKTNEWFEVTKEQETNFERIWGKSLKDSAFESKASSKPKKEAS